MRSLPINNPPNRWVRHRVEYDGVEAMELEVSEDHTRSIVSENDSPDVGFRFSLNPYRGCVHGCAYCYARPTHEYLGLGSGSDFERRIVIKLAAAELLRESFERPSWRGDTLVMSGVTDCYQPLEARLRLTRACLEVCVEYRNPVHIITKGTLVERDLDLLLALQRRARVGVTVSIPFWDEAIARAIEPYAPSPARRMAVVRTLSAAGLPVSVNVAPLIPALNDTDMVRILEAAKAAGAQSAHYVLLRLPGNVEPVFVQRLREVAPLRAERVLSRIREARGGRLSDARFFSRMRGQGEYVAALEHLFAATVQRLGLEGRDLEAGEGHERSFQRPARPGTQLGLFDKRSAE